MKREKWLKQEIDAWVSQGLITPEAGLGLKSIYPDKENPNILFLVFSIAGAILLGAGIILIFAKNWYELPVFFRVGLSFLPLFAGQGLTAFVFFKRRASLAWREGVAVFLTLAVFGNQALIGQIFHLSAAFDNYILICALLSLPVIYILDAVAPALIYTWAVLNWSDLNTGAYIYEGENYRVWWLILFMALLAPFIAEKIKNKREGVRGQLLLWLTAFGGFFAVLFLNISLMPLGGILLAAALCFYFFLIYAWAASHGNGGGYYPLKIVGALGAFTLLYIYSYFGSWGGLQLGETGLHYAYIPNLILALSMLGGGLWLFLPSKKEPLNLAFTLSPLLLGFLLLIKYFSGLSEGFFFALLVNGMVLALSILIILRGVKEINLFYTNTGMAALCFLIILRFFDWEMDFLARGIAFVILGAAFLGANLYLIKRRKAVAK